MILERSLYGPLIAGAAKEGFHLYRIADGGYGKKPFDIGGISPHGHAVAVEVKVATSIDKGFNQLEQHQEAWLALFEARHCLGIFIVNFGDRKICQAIRYAPMTSRVSTDGETAIDIPSFTKLDIGIRAEATLTLQNNCYVGWSPLLR